MMSMAVNYEKIEYLGAGTYGKVQKVQRVTDGKILACKVIKLKKSTDLDDAENECHVLRQLRHPNIVSYVDYECIRYTLSNSQSIGSRPPKLKLFMEYCPEGSLQDLIETNQRDRTSVYEALVWQVMYQLASALRYCHYGTRADGFTERCWQPVLHRDIKPANVLISARRTDTVTVKLADFGLAKVMDPESPPDSYAGTHLYQPPEITRSNNRGIQWTKACDIFSLGCTMFSLCNSSPPFAYRMEENDKCPDLSAQYSNRLNACVCRCLALHPETRHDAFVLIRISEIAQQSGEIGASDTSQNETQHAAQPESAPIVEAELTRKGNKEAKPPFVRSSSDLGETTYLKDRYSATSTISQKALHLQQSTRGRDPEPSLANNVYSDEDMDVAVDFVLQARDQFRRGHTVQSELSLRKALSIYEKVDRLESKQTADCLKLLGTVQEAQLKYPDAETTLQVALGIYEKTSGLKGKDTANCLHRLGKVLERQQRYLDAETTFQRALSVYEKTGGSEGEDAALCLYWLGKVQSMLQNPAARKTLRDARDAYIRLYGAKSACVGECTKLLLRIDGQQRKVSNARLVSKDHDRNLAVVLGRKKTS